MTVTLAGANRRQLQLTARSSGRVAWSSAIADEGESFARVVNAH